MQEVSRNKESTIIPRTDIYRGEQRRLSGLYDPDEFPVRSGVTFYLCRQNNLVFLPDYIGLFNTFQ